MAVRKGDVLKRYNLSPKVYNEWVKARPKIEEAVSQRRGKLTDIRHNDPYRRIKDGLLSFYERNCQMPKILKLPITSKCTGLSAFLFVLLLTSFHLQVSRLLLRLQS